MRESVTRWAQGNAQTIALMRRCWHGAPTDADRDALSAWVTETVMRGYPLFDRSGDRRAMDLPYVCDQGDCTARYAEAKGLGVHKRWAHGIKGTKGHPHTKVPEGLGLAAARREAKVPPDREAQEPGEWHLPHKPETAPPPKPVIPVINEHTHAEQPPKDVLAIFFTDMPLDLLQGMFGPTVKLRVVAGKGLAVLKGSAT